MLKLIVLLVGFFIMSACETQDFCDNNLLDQFKDSPL